MINNKIFVATTLGNDPHTEGAHNAIRIAGMVGIKSFFINPSLTYDDICEAIRNYRPGYVGLSYRLSPEVGADQLEKIIYYFYNNGIIKSEDKVKICFAGLPETIKLLETKIQTFPLKVELVYPQSDPIRQVISTINFFEIIHQKENIIAQLRDELIPAGIKIFDQLADEVLLGEDYKNESSLPLPSEKAKINFIDRIKESQIPLLRTHFGIPDLTILPTIEGIKQISEARVVDEISLGSSDLSQRFFGNPEAFKVMKNDGGVPYKDINDLSLLFQASRRGNFPSMKPYCHVVNIVDFIDICIKAGMLLGAHQAIPLFWFNELDKRGPLTVRDSIYEHLRAVRKLASLGIPVEMNDPNQWSSRLAHDTIITTSYALISAVMTMCHVENMILQMQFNKPKETGDYADLAKMFAGFELATIMASYRKKPANIFLETRTGIESLSSDINKARWQLGRSTLLQMCVNPSVIHIVSYCEANYAARPEDIIDSSKLIRRAIKIFRQNEYDIKRELETSVITDRKEYLVSETNFLLKEIAKLNPRYSKGNRCEVLTPLLGNPDTLAKAIENKIMTAPGIINEKYKGLFLTKPTKYGMINLVDSYTNPVIVSEKERINSLL